MSPAIFALPDTPTPAVSDAPADGGWLQAAWGQVTAWIDTVPPLVWVAAIAVLGLATVLLIPFLRSAAYKAGARHGKTPTAAERADRRLLIAAMIPASLFWIAVLTGSGRGLVAFGREDLGWHDGWEFLVPLTLDGVAIAFALLAFRAVKKNQNPDRSVRIAAAAMLASALINFAHEVGGSKLGAGYLAILSMLGMLIFDELLAQFEQGAENEVRRKNPKFGLRWLTWPTNTACAWIAWHNHPVGDGVKATIGNALANLDRVRLEKTTTRAEKIDSPAWWMRFAPWAHIEALRLTLTEQRSAVEAERLRSDQTISEFEQRIAAGNQATADMVERLRKEAERQRSADAEQFRNALAERDSRITALEGELAGKVRQLRDASTRSGATTSKNRPQPKSAPARRNPDTEALQKMFEKHPEPGYPWAEREVNNITGAGFSSRAPRLVRLASEHLAQCPEQTHKTCYTERSEGDSDDAKEQSA